MPSSRVSPSTPSASVKQTSSHGMSSITFPSPTVTMSSTDTGSPSESIVSSYQPPTTIVQNGRLKVREDKSESTESNLKATYDVSFPCREIKSAASRLMSSSSD